MKKLVLSFLICQSSYVLKTVQIDRQMMSRTLDQCCQRNVCKTHTKAVNLQKLLSKKYKMSRGVKTQVSSYLVPSFESGESLGSHFFEPPILIRSGVCCFSAATFHLVRISTRLPMLLHPEYQSFLKSRHKRDSNSKKRRQV